MHGILIHIEGIPHFDILQKPEMGIPVTSDNGIAGGGKTPCQPQPHRTFRDVIGMFVPPYKNVPMLTPEAKSGNRSRGTDHSIPRRLEARLCPLPYEGGLVCFRPDDNEDCGSGADKACPEKHVGQHSVPHVPILQATGGDFGRTTKPRSNSTEPPNKRSGQ